MNNDTNNNIPVLQIFWTILISFFCAFVKELNDYAKTPKEKHNFLLFVSEILLSGVCGSLIGILTMYFINNVYIITFCSGIGGILGLQLIKLGFKVFLVLKNVDLDKVKIDELDKD